MSQANSRKNGNYGVIRVYDNESDRGKIRLAKITIRDEKTLYKFARHASVFAAENPGYDEIFATIDYINCG